MKVLYIDESGDHSLSAIDPQYPVFVLGGVIIDSSYAAGELTARLREFKVRLFGTADLILHTADICRNRNGFERLADRSFRERFYREINSLMEALDYRVVACAIRKDEYVTAQGAETRNPYLSSLHVLVEGFCAHIGDVEGGGLIVTERRGRALDCELELAWLRLQTGGTGRVYGPQIQKRVRALLLRSKSQNIAGLQLADLVVSPIGRFVLGKETREDFRIVERKFLEDPEAQDFDRGLVILPKKKVRTRYAVPNLAYSLPRFEGVLRRL